ncbi:hypothetical protein BDR22DRAFT_818095 [Usnea florida]
MWHYIWWKHSGMKAKVMTVDDPYYAHFRSRPLPHVFERHNGTAKTSGEDLPKWAEVAKVNAAWDILRDLDVNGLRALQTKWKYRSLQRWNPFDPPGSPEAFDFERNHVNRCESDSPSCRPHPGLRHVRRHQRVTTNNHPGLSHIRRYTMVTPSRHPGLRHQSSQQRQQVPPARHQTVGRLSEWQAVAHTPYHPSNPIASFDIRRPSSPQPSQTPTASPKPSQPSPSSSYRWSPTSKSICSFAGSQCRCTFDLEGARVQSHAPHQRSASSPQIVIPYVAKSRARTDISVHGPKDDSFDPEYLEQIVPHFRTQEHLTFGQNH